MFKNKEPEREISSKDDIIKHKDVHHLVCVVCTKFHPKRARDMTICQEPVGGDLINKSRAAATKERRRRCSSDISTTRKQPCALG